MNSDEPKVGKTWTVEGESDDEEARPIGKWEVDVDIDDDKSFGKEVKDTMMFDTETDSCAFTKWS